MNARTASMLVGAGRVAAGVGLLAAPGLATRPWLGEDSPATRVVATGFGARDLALGAGTLRAVTSGGDPRPWLVAGAFADIADMTATVLARRSLPSLGVAGVAAIAASGAALGLWAARQPTP
jgi:hypothetical protein